jgi:hypothetical protein
MALNHGGQPAPPNNPGIDGTNLALKPTPSSADTWVIPVTDNFNVSLEFTLSGSVATGIVNGANTYKVQYIFSGLGGIPGLTLPAITKTTNSGQFVYGDPDTTAHVTAGSLPVGTYEVVASVTIPAYQMAAFVELPILEIF